MTETDSSNPQTGSYIQVNGLDMYYEDYGTGRPLILLHGGTSTSQTWQPFLPIFMPHFRVITPDSRAHGRSNNPAGTLSYRLMADDIAVFIQVLNLVQPFIFGYSDGGQIALELGMHYPGLTGALVIGACATLFGIIAFVAVGQPQGGTSQPEASAWWFLGIIIAGLIFLLARFANQRRGAVAATMFATAAGLSYAFQAAVSKVFVT